jgi:hypothetical protein
VKYKLNEILQDVEYKLNEILQDVEYELILMIFHDVKFNAWRESSGKQVNPGAYAPVLGVYS